MTLDISIILNQMMIFAFLLCLGAVLFFLKLIDEKTLDSLGSIILKITMPAFFLSSLPSSCTREEFLSSAVYIFAALLIYAVLFTFAFLSARITHLTGDSFNIHIAQGTFSNAGFFGIPFVLAVFGNKGILYISIYMLIDQLMIWTVAYSLCMKTGNKLSIRQRIQKLINPSTFALLLVIILIIFNLKIPKTINTIITNLGGATSPLSMIYIGALLASLNVKDLFKNKGVYLIVLFKMIIAPIILFSIFHFVFSMPSLPCLVFTMISAFPSVIIVAIFAREEKSDYKYALSAIFITTLLCIATIPLVALIINYLL